MCKFFCAGWIPAFNCSLAAFIFNALDLYIKSGEFYVPKIMGEWGYQKWNIVKKQIIPSSDLGLVNWSSRSLQRGQVSMRSLARRRENEVVGGELSLRFPPKLGKGELRLVNGSILESTKWASVSNVLEKSHIINIGPYDFVIRDAR